MTDKYGHGEYGEGNYTFGGDPFVPEELIEYFPEIIPRNEETNFYKYIDAHQDEMADFNEDIDYLRQSHQIDNAIGEDLDHIGAMFGELGKRRGRGDLAYREYLKSVVLSFRGRGTIDGMKFAIAAGVGTDTENITITEDFERNEYGVRIDDIDTEFLSATVNTMAELSEPSGVSLADPPVVQTTGDSIRVTTQGSSVISSSSGIGSGSLSFDGSTTLS